MPKPPINGDLANFLAGAQVGRDKVKKVTLAELEAECEATEKQRWLKAAHKIWTDLKWELKKHGHTIPEILDLINDAIIDVGTKIKHEEVRMELVKRFEAMKTELLKTTP
jgi:uncharacterized protein (DUF111 family)